MLLSSFSAMSFYKNLSFLLLLAINVYSLVSSEGITITASADISSLNPPAPAVHPGLNSLFSFSQLSFPEDLEISDYCNELLHIFGQRYVAYVSCLVPAARPVKACLNCFPSFVNLENIYNNISEKVRVFKVTQSWPVFKCPLNCLQSACIQRRGLVRSSLLMSHESCDVTAGDI